MDNDAERIANEIDTVFSEWQTRAESYDEEHFFYGENSCQNRRTKERDV